MVSEPAVSGVSRLQVVHAGEIRRRGGTLFNQVEKGEGGRTSGGGGLGTVG